MSVSGILSDIRITADTYCLFHLEDGFPLLSKGLAHLLGCPIAEPVSLDRIVPSGDVPKLLRAVRAVRSGQMGQRMRTAVPGKPGHVFDWCFFPKGGVARVIGHVAVISRDGVDQEPLGSALAAISDGVALFDAQDRLSFCNAAYSRFFCPSGTETLIGKTFAEITEIGAGNRIHETAELSESCFRAQLNDSFQKGGLPIGMPLCDGGFIRILHHRLADGRTVAILAGVSDLARDRAEAVSANRAKTAFISIMSHELRTPLTSLLGMLDLLEDEPDGNRRAEMLEVVRRSGETLRDIVNDILDVSKIEAGKMRLEHHGFQPAEILRTTVERHREAARWKGIALTTKVEGSSGRLRRWDALRFGQILENLLSNAIKFTLVGRVDVELSDFPGKPLHLSVRDTGIGMTPEQIARVRQPFVQAEAETTRLFGGTGLGLSIVVKLVELTGGTLDIESTPGQGSLFRVSLPLDEMDSAARDETGQASSPASLTGRAVLVADDDAIIRDVISGYLRKAGAIVTVVADGQAAVDAALARRFDLVLLDNSMPGMTGTQAMQILRRSLGADCPPMVVATASSMEHEVKEFLQAGFDLHLPKPFRKDDVARLLSALLRQTGGA